MPKKKKYASKISGVLHRAAKGAVRVGAMDKMTMRQFDVLCLTQVRPLTANDIKNIRAANNVSQEVFAKYLNVTSTLVSQWERAEKSPSGPSLKLLNIVEEKGLDALA